MAKECDFLSETLKKEKMNNLKECVNACEKTKECTHYVFYLNHCFMKKGNVKKLDAFHSDFFTPWVGSNNIFDRDNVCGFPPKTCKKGC